MAFRSELEAAQHRAEAAEAETQRLKLELSSQTARMERVEEIEGQLETARAKLREQGPRAQTTALVSGAVLGALIALGGTFALGRTDHAADEAHSRDADRAHEESLRRANVDTENARLELTLMTEDRDDARAALRAESRDVRALLLAIGDAPSADVAAQYPVRLGRVIHVNGSTPLRVGALCDVVASESEGCAGVIRCGDVTVHSFGCSGRTPTELAYDSGAIVVSDPEWRVTLVTTLVR